MKRKILSLLLLLPISIILFIGIGGVQYSCGCVSNRDLMGMHMSGVHDIISEQKEKTGKYPTLEKLQILVKGVEKYEMWSIKERGIYYSLSEDGTSYVLKAYEIGDKLLFIKVLANVETGNIVKFEGIQFLSDSI